MSKMPIYIDEDAMDSDFVLALRSRGLNVLTAFESGLIGEDDETQLRFAASKLCVLYTCNICDFHRLHTQWQQQGLVHSGIIFVPQQRYSVGEQLQRILRLFSSLSEESIRNKIHFLSNWS
jgi:hypothetical protein